MYASDVEGFYYALDWTGFLGPDKHDVYVGLRVIGELYYLGILALFVYSLPTIFRSRRISCFAGIAVLIYFTLVYMVFMGDPRYHFAIMPWIAMYAGIGGAVLLSPNLADMNDVSAGMAIAV